MRIALPEVDLELKSVRQSGSSVGRFLWWSRTPDGNEATAVAVANKLLHTVKSSLTSQYYVQPRRSTRSMPYRTDYTLAPDGENLTTVVTTLFIKETYERFAELEDFMKDVFPEIQHVGAKTDNSNPPHTQIMLTLGRSGDLRVPLDLCGTGIEQALMLATAILTGSGGRLILIDEPHAFLHPHAERGVLRFIRRHAEHQYVIATHSSTFLTHTPFRKLGW
jgi:predicted ATPase